MHHSGRPKGSLFAIHTGATQTHPISARQGSLRNRDPPKLRITKIVRSMSCLARKNRCEDRQARFCSLMQIQVVLNCRLMHGLSLSSVSHECILSGQDQPSETS